MKVQIRNQLLLILCVCCLGFAAPLVVTVRAQSPVTWTEARVLAKTGSFWSRPTIATTSWGHIHVFWADRYYYDDLPSQGGGGKGDTLYHMMWDGQSWTEPLDIILQGGDAMSLEYPYATVGKDDQIYLIWSGRNALYFSSAPALNAHHAASWQPAQLIVEGLGIEQSRLIIGPDGRLHVLYMQLQGELAGNVAYTWSTDQGDQWSSPQPISQINLDEARAAADPRVVLDDQGWLHVVWAERSAPGWTGTEIFYSRSENGGEAWTSPELLASLEADEAWADSPSLATTADGSIHLVWLCGTGSPLRCYRASSDGGRSWSPRERILGELVGRGGWDAMTADQQGNLHLIALLRYPQGIYYSFKPFQGAWQPSRVVDQPEFANGHFFQMALSGGNQLHTVWQKSSDNGDVVYTVITTSASPPILFPVPTTASLPQATSSRETPPAVATPGDTHPERTVVPSVTRIDDNVPETQPDSPLPVFFWAVLPPAVLIALVAVLRLKSRLY